MATYYVDPVNGSDSNNGLGPDASHASNKPWKTLAKLLGASGFASGDTAYLAPGAYRETVTVAMTSAVAETKVLADPGNAQGFKTSGGVLVASGQVQWTAYTTNDKTAPAASMALDLNGRDFLTFQDILFVGGNLSGGCVRGATTSSTDIKFVRCAFLAGAPNVANVNFTAGFGVALNWTFDSCLWLSSANQTAINLVLTRGTGSDYDVNVLFKDCLIVGGAGTQTRIASTGAGVNFGGGVDFYNCTIIGGNNVISTEANVSTSSPCTVYNCVLIGGGTGLNANTSGQIVEDYNLIHAATARTNVSAGSNSQTTSYAPLIDIGQALLYGAQSRPFGSPTNGSPILGFGNQAGGPTVDLLGLARPSGGQSASKGIGAYERGNTWGKETSTVRTGSNALSITGPGTQDFNVPVDATSTTVSVYMRCDSTYAGTKPKIQVLNGSECGVADASSSAVSAADSWEQLSLNFTPTRQGIVTIRLLSSDTNGGGKAFADDFAIA